jgi:hypothetical protein
MSEDASLKDLEAKLLELLAKAGDGETWGVPLDADSPQRRLILKKYLAAHKCAVDPAAAGILATLQWGMSFDPAGAATEQHDTAKFGGLGYVTALAASSEKWRGRPVGGRRPPRARGYVERVRRGAGPRCHVR